jgi:hypothetical protein
MPAVRRYSQAKSGLGGVYEGSEIALGILKAGRPPMPARSPLGHAPPGGRAAAGSVVALGWRAARWDVPQFCGRLRLRRDRPGRRRPVDHASLARCIIAELLGGAWRRAWAGRVAVASGVMVLHAVFLRRTPSRSRSRSSCSTVQRVGRSLRGTTAARPGGLADDELLDVDAGDLGLELSIAQSWGRRGSELASLNRSRLVGSAIGYFTRATITAAFTDLGQP